MASCGIGGGLGRGGIALAGIGGGFCFHIGGGSGLLGNGNSGCVPVEGIGPRVTLVGGGVGGPLCHRSGCAPLEGVGPREALRAARGIGGGVAAPEEVPVIAGAALCTGALLPLALGVARVWRAVFAPLRAASLAP